MRKAEHSVCTRSFQYVRIGPLYPQRRKLCTCTLGKRREYRVNFARSIEDADGVRIEAPIYNTLGQFIVDFLHSLIWNIRRYVSKGTCIDVVDLRGAVNGTVEAIFFTHLHAGKDIVEIHTFRSGAYFYVLFRGAHEFVKEVISQCKRWMSNDLGSAVIAIPIAKFQCGASANSERKIKHVAEKLGYCSFFRVNIYKLGFGIVERYASQELDCMLSRNDRLYFIEYSKEVETIGGLENKLNGILSFILAFRMLPRSIILISEENTYRREALERQTLGSKVHRFLYDELGVRISLRSLKINNEELNISEILEEEILF